MNFEILILLLLSMAFGAVIKDIAAEEQDLGGKVDVQSSDTTFINIKGNENNRFKREVYTHYVVSDDGIRTL